MNADGTPLDPVERMERISKNVNSSNKAFKIIVLSLVGFFVIAIVIALLYAHSENQDDIQKAQQQHEARIAVCLAFNNQQEAIRATFEKAHIALANALAPEPTAEEQVRIDAWLETERNTINAQLPDRDCSPEGITAFYTTSTTIGG